MEFEVNNCECGSGLYGIENHDSEKKILTLKCMNCGKIRIALGK